MEPINIAETLTPVFGQTPHFFSDSLELVNWLKSVSCNAFEFKELERLSSREKTNVVLIAMDEKSIPSYKEMNTHFSKSRVLIIPMLSFDSSIDAAIYTMTLLGRSTIETACHLNQQWLHLLLEHKEPFILRGNGCELVCEIDEGVCVLAPKIAVQLDLGEWTSIGSYFEVGMVPQPDDFRPAFKVNGTLSVAGVAVAHHRQMHADLLHLPLKAWNVLQQIQKQKLFPLQINIENSCITSIVAGDQDLSDELEYLSNKRYELTLTEMAFSTNAGIRPEFIDWTKNSQLNEGAIGIHVAVGEGLTGAHIDFICPEVDIVSK